MVYTHATPRGGAWDSLPGRLRAPRLAPEPSRDTAGRPLRSTPPHTGDALALKALHPWRDARPAHTEGHVAAAPPALLAPASFLAGAAHALPGPAPPGTHIRAPSYAGAAAFADGDDTLAAVSDERKAAHQTPFPALRPHGSVSAPGTWPPPRTKTSSAPPGSN